MFKREFRYIVIKCSDLQAALPVISVEQLLVFREVCHIISKERASKGKEPLDCVVVEKDWPEYEPTWRAIESRMTESSIQPGKAYPASPPAADTYYIYWCPQCKREIPWQDGVCQVVFAAPYTHLTCGAKLDIIRRSDMPRNAAAQEPKHDAMGEKGKLDDGAVPAHRAPDTAPAATNTPRLDKCESDLGLAWFGLCAPLDRAQDYNRKYRGLIVKLERELAAAQALLMELHDWNCFAAYPEHIKERVKTAMCGTK